jgi:peptidoglycan hydrolase CwlO-like protein
MTDQIVHTVLQTAGMGGALALITYLLVTRTVPKLHEDHKQELKELHAAHRADLADQRDKYHELLQREHATFENMVTRLTAAVQELQSQIRDHTGVLMNLHALIARCQDNGRPPRHPPQDPKEKSP